MTIRRLKTYAGSQGYVYQYYFVGRRPSQSTSATEYIFDVTSDRKTTQAVTVVLPQEVVAAWNRMHGRALADSEQYAAVKLRLFRAFDEMEDLHASGRQFPIELQALEASLATLGIE